MDATPSPTDREQFEALVIEHQSAICAIAYSVLRDRARSEEVAQDALLIAWRDHTTTTITPGWICGIAKNLARNAARRRTEVTMTDLDREASASRDARDLLIAREDAARANAALAKLPDAYRDAITIYYRTDESYADVATALGITEDLARQRVHRGRTKLRERLAIVETSLRATRPGPAFTAAVVAAWTLGRVPSASAATASSATASKVGWLLPAIGVGAVASAATIALAVRSGAADAEPPAALPTTHVHSPSRESMSRRFPAARHARIAPSLPPGVTPVSSFSVALSPRANAPVDFDFQQAPFDALVSILANTMDVPMWTTLDDAPRIDVRVKDAPAIDVLDGILADAGATRSEVAAIRIVERGRTDATSLDGDLMSLDVRDMPFNQFLDLVEPKLAMPIGRFGVDVPEGVVDSDGNPIGDPTRRVTLSLQNQPAGVVLERALQQTGYGYEMTTGFVITD